MKFALARPARLRSCGTSARLVGLPAVAPCDVVKSHDRGDTFGSLLLAKDLEWRPYDKGREDAVDDLARTAAPDRPFPDLALGTVRNQAQVCKKGTDATQKGGLRMADLKVFYDREGHTLTVWFADRSQEYACTEAGDEVVLMKDRSGRVIGVEKLHFAISESEPMQIVLEMENRRRT